MCSGPPPSSPARRAAPHGTLSLHYADDVKLLIDGSVEGEGLSFRGKVDPAERATTRSVLGVARDRAAA